MKGILKTMKFSELSKLTKQGSYQINMFLNYLLKL